MALMQVKIGKRKSERNQVQICKSLIMIPIFGKSPILEISSERANELKISLQILSLLMKSPNLVRLTVILYLCLNVIVLILL